MRPIALLFIAAAAWGQIAPINSTGAQSTNANTVTTPSISAAGASCVLVNTVAATACSAVLTDSQGTASYSVIYDVTNATTGAENKLYAAPKPGGGFSGSMTWTYGATGCVPTMQVLAVSGTSTSATCGLDANPPVTNPAGMAPMTLNYTPTAANEIWVSSIANCSIGSPAATPSVGTSVSPFACISGFGYGLSFAYGIQSGGPTAVSEVWSIGVSSGIFVNGGIAAFQPGAAPSSAQGYIIVQ